MAERKAVNKYYPPDWTPNKGSINKFRGTHALRERARKLHMGILIIRFEMPFNIWCNGCENHIGMGVRYNAEKTKVGMYYTTPIYKFRMKCHLCTNHFEIQTDPANLDYVILNGARRQERRWDPTQNEQVVPEEKEVSKKLMTDSMFCLEHNVNDKVKQKTILPSLRKLEESREKWKDDYLLNKTLRQQFREKKREIACVESKDKQLLKRCSLNITLLPEVDEDRKLAGLLKLAPLYNFEEKQKLKREETMSRPLFPLPYKNMPILASSVRESKMKELLKPLTKTELGITLKNERDNILKSTSHESEESGSELEATHKNESKNAVAKMQSNESENPKESSDLKASLVACDYDSSDSDEEKT
ncbi:coiled-coil domain-containing protein 130 homolog [Argiope bruennichi]|uniref:Coiled-coil domain-containing protein 130 n=1 Tax=Argiope bruennichi TaxID=94029 RepID=A0A8T0EUN9_ARGBR|nr:coiled-coil domain-containing protein 130 homolog [Argiope bruennichi]KAF8782036.1 Coiled-coil domain-containing protein 130 [Argiope bruennichi]